MLNKIISVAAALPFLAACAVMNASADPLAPQQMSLVNATCTQVMGLRRGEYYYQMCQESLGGSLANKVAAQKEGQAYDVCRHQGLNEGSPAFSTCILDGQNQSTARAPSMTSQINLIFPRDALKSDESYFNVTNEIHWKREQYSCAQLGLEPGTGSFQQCVAGLDAALFSSPN